MRSTQKSMIEKLNIPTAKKAWVLKDVSSEEAQQAARLMCQDLGIHKVTAGLLFHRGCRTAKDAEDFIACGQEILCDAFLMQDMEKAVDRILSAVNNNERIVIYGDYDVDGVTSVATLYLYLQSIGADIHYHIPNRIGDGYGVSKPTIDLLKKADTKLIITVDTGITANDEILYAKTLGIDTVVTDHHECRNELPEAVAVVNPHRPDCPYPFKELAGVGVVFKVVCAIEEKRTGKSKKDVVGKLALLYADLVAIGSIADVMPLRGENRLIVKLGLELMHTNRRMGLDVLVTASNASRASKQTKTRAGQAIKITSGYIGYTIAPRLNAAGRIRTASLSADLFLSKNQTECQMIAEQLCLANKERQNEENRIIEEAYAKIEAEHDFNHDPVIVLDADNWHHCVICIVSSRITEKYGLTSILISFECCDLVQSL